MKLGTAAVDFNRPCQTGCRARAGSRKAHCTSQPVARPPAAGHAGPSEKGFRQKDLKGTSRALGTCGIRLWLLPSGPDQVPGPQCEEARPGPIVYEAGARANRNGPKRTQRFPGASRGMPFPGQPCYSKFSTRMRLTAPETAGRAASCAQAAFISASRTFSVSSTSGIWPLCLWRFF